MTSIVHLYLRKYLKKILIFVDYINIIKTLENLMKMIS